MALEIYYLRHEMANSSTNIPHLYADDIELDAFIGERLVPECLARCTDAFF